jgi:hypothetical protein
MPKEVKVVDKTMRKDPSTGKMVKSENYRNDVWNVKTATVKRGGVVRKKITGETFEAIRGGKPISEKSIKIEKFDRSGKLKKATTISNEKKLGMFDRYRLNKNT